MPSADRVLRRIAELQLDRRSRLGGALAASLLVHALLIVWPLPVSSGGAPRAAPPAANILRVSLNLITEAHASPAPEVPRPVEAAVPVPAPAVQSASAAVLPEAQNAVSLLGYYPVGRLSRMPAAISVFDIQPPAGGDSGIGGKLTLRIWIGAQGGIDSVRVLASSLPAAYEAAALAAFEKMRFEAGQIDGTAVPSWADIVIEYDDFRR